MQKDIPCSALTAKAAVRSLLTQEKIHTQEVALYLVSRKKMCSLHEQFFHKKTVTDCISLYYDPTFLGEVFVCPWAALSFTHTYGGNPKQELFRYIFHGFLHLIGYNDKTTPEKRIMRRRENKYLRQLFTC